MADLIERDALLNDLKESVKFAREWKEEAQNEEIKIRAEQAHGTFIECALRVKNAPAVNRWIPVKDALPEQEVRILLFAAGEVYVGELTDIKDLFDTDIGFMKSGHVTHWMPLPSTEGLT